jgi:ribosomal protein L7/L12
MNDMDNGNNALFTALNTLAYIAAENVGVEKSAVRSALYAASLAVEMNLSPAEAAQLATECAWDEPQRTINAAVQLSVEQWETTQQAELYAPAYHVAPDVREEVAELYNNGRKIAAIKMLREHTLLGPKECKDLAEVIGAEYSIHGTHSIPADNLPPF